MVDSEKNTWTTELHWIIKEWSHNKQLWIFFLDHLYSVVPQNHQPKNHQVVSCEILHIKGTCSTTARDLKEYITMVQCPSDSLVNG
ncbi:unnamed protein product [Staurois parvus]|uniref:Uncharacterized protein n=1 Tax=Staurois parvus TaxID=386267 RepID=A0ABN9FHX3_9NEOB|nr:unnamed protein product [Staurois parvus]